MRTTCSTVWIALIFAALVACRLSEEVRGIKSAPALTVPKSASLPIFGVQSRALTIEEGLDQLSSLPVTWVRRDGPLWMEIEAEEGKVNWTGAINREKEFLDAVERGLEIILVIRGTPEWAQHPESRGYSCGRVDPAKLPAFVEFLSKYVERYSSPPFGIKYFELWNEPDIDPALVAKNSGFGCWGDPSDEFFGGGTYAEMLRAVYPAIKAVDPSVQLLVGGLLLDCNVRNPPEVPPGSGQSRDCSSAKFLEGILFNAGGAYFDGVSFHAYDYFFDVDGYYGNSNWHSDSRSSGPVMVSKAAYIRELFQRYGISDKYLINTEQALICGRSVQEGFCRDAAFQATKSAYVVQSYATALSLDLRANIWYSLRGWRASGLIRQDLSPEPAYAVYSVVVRELTGAVYVRTIEPEIGVIAHVFEKAEKEVWVIWSTDAATHPINLEAAPEKVLNMYGDQVNSDGPIELTWQPFYIYWNRAAN